MLSVENFIQINTCFFPAVCNFRFDSRTNVRQQCHRLRLKIIYQIYRRFSSLFTKAFNNKSILTVYSNLLTIIYSPSNSAFWSSWVFLRVSPLHLYPLNGVYSSREWKNIVLNPSVWEQTGLLQPARVPWWQQGNHEGFLTVLRYVTLHPTGCFHLPNPCNSTIPSYCNHPMPS